MLFSKNSRFLCANEVAYSFAHSFWCYTNVGLDAHHQKPKCHKTFPDKGLPTNPALGKDRLQVILASVMGIHDQVSHLSSSKTQDADCRSDATPHPSLREAALEAAKDHHRRQNQSTSQPGYMHTFLHLNCRLFVGRLRKWRYDATTAQNGSTMETKLSA